MYVGLLIVISSILRSQNASTVGQQLVVVATIVKGRRPNRFVHRVGGIQFSVNYFYEQLAASAFWVVHG